MTRAIESACILAIGTELTTGSTRDTNSGDLARELTKLGVRVQASLALPDDLGRVAASFSNALVDADLVVSTGGLGPTPDDLTREAIAASCGLETFVDASLLDWLEEMFARRGAPMPEANRKQAWLIEGATALPNAHGSAPGWWVERPDGRLIIALPGPPREMRPMWHDHALPRLRAGRIGVDHAAHTLRLTGIGESALVALIGEGVLRTTNPQVATYARADAVDLVVSAVAEGERSARAVVDEAVAGLRPRIGQYVFADGDETWAGAIGALLGSRTLATVEIATAGQLVSLLGSATYLVHAELARGSADQLAQVAERTRQAHGADVGLAVFARQARDTHVRIAIAVEGGVTELQRTAFLAGDEGRRRAALAACAALWETLRDQPA